MSRPERPLGVAEAVALGLLHGPAELLPISSSAHVALVPWLLGWDYTGADDELRKSFEVALHAGTAAALLTAVFGEVSDRRLRHVLAVSAVPPALAGYAFERSIERRLGTPRSIACGLVAGAVAIALADRRPQRRTVADSDFGDALWLGVAQACALFPGVSRSGATLATARLRSFTRADAGRLSRATALPVIAGATLLKGMRLRRRRLRGASVAPFAAGTAASFASGLACVRLVPRLDRSPLPYVAYRAALAGLVLARLRARSEGSTTMDA